MTTTIDRPVLEKIETHLVSSYPHEACGFLLGKESKGNRQITSMTEVENRSTENLRRRFVIDPLDYMKAERQAAKDGLVLIGIYHSHPDHPAIPSEHDLEYAQPYFSYFIHSIRDGKMVDTKSYLLSNGVFVEEEFGRED